MLHVWYVYLQNWAILGVNVGTVNINQTWSMFWICFPYVFLSNDEETHAGPMFFHRNPLAIPT